MTASLTGWIAYAADRGTAVASDELSSQALVRASDYIRTRYLLSNSISTDDERAVEATYMAAKYELENPGFWSTTFTPASAKTLTKVDGIQWTMQSNASMEKGYNAQIPVSPAINALFGGTSPSGIVLMVVG